MGPIGLGSMNHCAAKSQHQFSNQSVSDNSIHASWKYQMCKFSGFHRSEHSGCLLDCDTIQSSRWILTCQKRWKHLGWGHGKDILVGWHGKWLLRDVGGRKRKSPINANSNNKMELRRNFHSIGRVTGIVTIRTIGEKERR
jgi:hypothetical protein